jgi:SAM-dependent methyltransferase
LSFDALTKALDEMLQSVSTVGALGAALHARSENIVLDERFDRALNHIVAEVNGSGLEEMSPADTPLLYARIVTTLRQSLDLLENPGRPPGWHIFDPAIIDSQGRASRIIVHRIESIAAQRPSLEDTLRRRGRFLDIGTGAGWIAIEAASRWPTLDVIGIDIWAPSIELAKKNVAHEHPGKRITIRKQAVEDLTERNCYGLIWLPGPFLSAEAVAKALPGLQQSLVPGGTLVFGFYSPPPARLERLVLEAQVIRSGGHPWSPEEVEALLSDTGFSDIGRYGVSSFLTFCRCQTTFLGRIKQEEKNGSDGTDRGKARRPCRGIQCP